jgi:hypothetical protein
MFPPLPRSSGQERAFLFPKAGQAQTVGALTPSQLRYIATGRQSFRLSPLSASTSETIFGVKSFRARKRAYSRESTASSCWLEPGRGRDYSVEYGLSGKISGKSIQRLQRGTIKVLGGSGAASNGVPWLFSIFTFARPTMPKSVSEFLVKGRCQIFRKNRFTASANSISS